MRSLAEAAKESELLTPLLPVKDTTPSQLDGSGDVSAVWDVVGPGLRNLDHPHARHAKRIITWTVDDSRQARVALANEAVVGVVTNAAPGQMARVLRGLCELR